MLWAVKNSAGASYEDMKTPSDLKIDWEDLDSNSYRSITTGNLNRNIVSTKWLKASLKFNYLTESEVENIMQKINTYPLYVKIKSPLFGTSGVFECQAYVSKASISMQQNKTNPTWYDLSFDIVQSKKVSGQ